MKKYKYLHEENKGPPGAIDVHHIISHTIVSKPLIVVLLLLLVVYSCFLFFLLQGKSAIVLLCILSLGVFLVAVVRRKSVKKESVIILPAFGLQLEAQYGSGGTIRRFVPISKILKAVLNECVTPVTCYWTLSLIIREEEELMLVFRELRPPVKMLIPVWKALCLAIDSDECTEKFT